MAVIGVVRTLHGLVGNPIASEPEGAGAEGHGPGNHDGDGNEQRNESHDC